MVMKQMLSSTTVWVFGVLNSPVAQRNNRYKALTHTHTHRLVSRKYAISSWALHYVMTPTFISNTI